MYQLSEFRKGRLSSGVKSCLKKKYFIVYRSVKNLPSVGLQEAPLQSVRRFDWLWSPPGEVLVKQGASPEEAGQKRCECWRPGREQYGYCVWCQLWHIGLIIRLYLCLAETFRRHWRSLWRWNTRGSSVALTWQSWRTSYRKSVPSWLWRSKSLKLNAVSYTISICSH